MVEEIKAASEVFQSLGGDALDAFAWWLAYKFLVSIGGYALAAFGITVVFRLVKHLINSFSSFKTIHAMYGYAGEVYCSESKAILERISKDITKNGPLE